MLKFSKLVLAGAVLLLPVFVFSQVQPAAKDSLSKPPDSVAKVIVDTIRVVIDTVVKKDCYAEYYDIMRARGAKPITDGMHPVVIALKGESGCRCFMGQIEVTNGKMKAPLYFQAENGEFRPVSTVGKKLEPAFTASMTADELYSVKDGMSIVFRTSDQEYGRLFFYTFINKGASSNKSAPPPSELIKE